MKYASFVVYGVTGKISGGDNSPGTKNTCRSLQTFLTKNFSCIWSKLSWLHWCRLSFGRALKIFLSDQSNFSKIEKDIWKKRI